MYSPLFETIYDEQSPVGNIGRGSHYSVLSAVQWFDNYRKLISGGEGRLQRFGIIWDEDHDTRLIPAIENAYMRGILSPVRFIGERKGYLTILLDAEFVAMKEDALLGYKETWKEVLEDSVDDYWEVEIASEWEPHSIIADRSDAVSTYLKNIQNLWKIGLMKHPSQTPRSTQNPIFSPSPSPLPPTA